MGVATEVQLDALRELANIGGGHAATALSKLMGGDRFLLDVPAAFQSVSEAPWMDEEPSKKAWVVTAFKFKGELEGYLLWALPIADAHQICAALLHSHQSGALNENEKSAVGEVANILASSCLSAIEGVTGFKLRPSIPWVCEGAWESVTQMFRSQSEVRSSEDIVLAIHLFDSPLRRISGHLFILPRAESVQALYQRMGVA